MQGWYNQGKSGRKQWFSVKSGKVRKNQGKLGNSSGAQGEKSRLKFESQ